MKTFWERTLNSRPSRRKVLVGGASLAGAAALLAACGGGNDDTPSEAQAGKYKVFDDTKAETPVKTGGTYYKHINADLPSLNPYKASSVIPGTNVGVYSLNTLVGWKTGPGVTPNDFEVAPDLAESWEISNGGLTYTFKLRQGVKFHNIAPVNGHLFDSEDVIASWARFKDAPNFQNIHKGLVESITAPDKQTIVFKLTSPDVAFLSSLAALQFFLISPREADISYDPAATPIGAGPFQLKNYQPSSRLEFVRNPEYYEKGLPYLDGAVTYIIPEVAQQLAQFQAGALSTYSPSQFEDFKALLEAVPGLRIISNGMSSSQPGINFMGIEPKQPDAPWIKDSRVRRAFSLALDRQTITESFIDLEKYESIGLPRRYRFPNWVPANLEKWWVDPRGKEMGDAAQWWQYDVAKAKQLLSAAGYPNGFDIDFHVPANNIQAQINATPIVAEWFKAVGIRPKLISEDYFSVLNPISWRGKGGDGITFLSWQTFSDPGQQLQTIFGATSNQNSLGVNDPKFNEMYSKQQVELDPAKRRALLIPMYQYLSEEMRALVVALNSADSFALFQPNWRNNNAFVGGNNFKYWWLAA